MMFFYIRKKKITYCWQLALLRNVIVVYGYGYLPTGDCVLRLEYVEDFSFLLAHHLCCNPNLIKVLTKLLVSLLCIDTSSEGSNRVD